MDTLRRERFTAWFLATFGEGEGARSRFMQATGLSKGRVSQLLDPDFPFGEVCARNIARRVGLADSFFSDPLGDADRALAADLRELHRLAPSDYAAVRKIVRESVKRAAAERLKGAIDAQSRRTVDPRKGTRRIAGSHPSSLPLKTAAAKRAASDPTTHKRKSPK